MGDVGPSKNRAAEIIQTVLGYLVLFVLVALFIMWVNSDGGSQTGDCSVDDGDVRGGHGSCEPVERHYDPPDSPAD